MRNLYVIYATRKLCNAHRIMDQYYRKYKE